MKKIFASLAACAMALTMFAVAGCGGATPDDQVNSGTGSGNTDDSGSGEKPGGNTNDSGSGEKPGGNTNDSGSGEKPGGNTDNPGSGGRDTLVLWGPSAQQDSLQEMVDLFLEENPDFGLKIELGVAGEVDVYAMMAFDPKAGADVFAYANDQVINLLSIGALAELTDSTVQKLKEENLEDAVNAGKVGDSYYGYPYAADNGYFMYYDKSVISEEQAKTLDGVLEACKAKNTYLLGDFTSPWYASSFIYGAGGEYSADYDFKTRKWSITCNFDQKAPGSEYTYGELGGQQLIDLYSHPACADFIDAKIPDYLKLGKMGACITGVWHASDIESYLGDNYAATVLPKWTSTLDGKTYDLKTFAGYKLYGVNSFSSHLPEAHQLAAFLSGAAMQEKRFDDSAIGPSNKTVAALDKVQDNVAFAAVNKQFDTNSVIQTTIPSSYWNEIQYFATNLKNMDVISLELVQRLVAALKAN